MATEQAKEKFTILLVEDNPGDIRLTQEILKTSSLIETIHIAYDGEEAMQFLLRKAPFQNAPTPDLIILDLNLPRKSGIETLAELKKNHDISYIPVIVLTSSEAQHDISRAYNLYANAYITKPVDFEQYAYVVGYIEKFWFTLVKLPKN